ncbi:cobalt-precorrin 5A hydrolase [Heliorestis convoluta]|uniref:Cobalamin biosynthesis protein CbiG n=1 Tax=Heliorestis convoluta TaxID=356322 RepID=A0A5Q2MY93_9FIRM|nr:cobalamin biosynthesis protein [Heliorestis convoluta]QGG46901.1 cobalamin biosynthesis protein CbiG [Heliorestis convoluta]
MNIIALTPGGANLGSRIASVFPESILWIPEDLDFLGETNRYRRWKKPLQPTFGGIYQEGRPILFIGALAILVRFLGPLMTNKKQDPPVVALDEKGHHVIAVLSGHWGGANELAHQVAQAIDAKPVITTATDVVEVPAVDLFARRYGARIDPWENVKKISSALLRQQPVQWLMEEKFLQYWQRYIKNKLSPLDKEYKVAPELQIPWQTWTSHIKDEEEKRELALGDNKGNNLTVLCTSTRKKSPATITLYPRYIVAGIGCRRGVSLEKVKAALHQAFVEAEIDERCLLAIASGWIKKEEPALVELARERELPFYTFQPYEIENCCNQHEEITASSFVYQTIGVKALCEPAALLVHQRSRLLVTKRSYGPVTIALAEAPWPLLDSVQQEKMK